MATNTGKSSTASKKRKGIKTLEAPKSTDDAQLGNALGARGQKRKHLNERLQLLYQRATLIEEQLKNLDANRFYRVCIFGSARIKTDTKAYDEVYTLARYLAWEGIDILTGGGPGLMEAANKGAQLGRVERKSKSLSFGLSIELPFEPEPNMHLDVKRHHYRFSSRLDDFMRLSHSVIATPGGIGTILELAFAWQLIQVGHMEMKPIILMGKDFWGGFLSWMKEFPLSRALMSPKDFDVISLVDTPEEVFELISQHHKAFRKNGAVKS